MSEPSAESLAPWRVGSHYGIHVYEGDRPVATFHREEEARQCVTDRARIKAADAVAEAARYVIERIDDTDDGWRFADWEERLSTALATYRALSPAGEENTEPQRSKA